uniref:Cytochrome b n=1 Tax=Arrenurus rostratus TaxID=3136836 RepID=A0AAU6QEC9_9ACAR
MKKKISNISPIVKTMKNSILSLPTPSNISYMWNFGSMLGFNLMIQILTGIFISMHYTPHTSMAFESTIHIIRDTNMGWLMRTLHMNMASLFFILIYLHIGRNMMFSSFKKEETWTSGIMITFVLMGTAFMGYVLPWGQMSFWGATVITNLISAIPFIGTEIVQWVWGGFSVSNATLNRFFSFHFLFPFILSALVIIHIITLHEYGSSNPTGIKNSNEMMKFHPYFSWKDMITPILFFISIMIITLMNPNMMGDPENFNPANPMMTPIHIQPEWYFLFAYAILRAIPNKIGGVIALVMSIVILLFLSMTKKMYSSCKFNPQKKITFWTFATSFILLSWEGAKQIEEPFDLMSKITSVIYFASVMMI